MLLTFIRVTRIFVIIFTTRSLAISDGPYVQEIIWKMKQKKNSCVNQILCLHSTRVLTLILHLFGNYCSMLRCWALMWSARLISAHSALRLMCFVLCESIFGFHLGLLLLDTSWHDILLSELFGFYLIQKFFIFDSNWISLLGVIKFFT